MKLTIVYDNDIYKKDIGLKSDWGFSCLIETGEETILFDTGAKGRLLLYNMKKLDVNPGNISKIVISHEHWDHNGGLESLIAFVVDAELYRLGTKSPSGKIDLTTVEEPQNIATKVWTTGRLNGTPLDEQSLVLKGEDGWYVLAGCLHPGVEEILNVAKQHGEIVGLVGGLHEFDNYSILDELDWICPCHCTAHKKKIHELIPKKYVEGGVGKSLEL